MELGHAEAIKQTVMAGLGEAMASIYAVRGELETGRLQQVAFENSSSSGTSM
jgi:DNA-binding transcriptional LysR family regulator